MQLQECQQCESLYKYFHGHASLLAKNIWKSQEELQTVENSAGKDTTPVTLSEDKQSNQYFLWLLMKSCTSHLVLCFSRAYFGIVFLSSAQFLTLGNISHTRIPQLHLVRQKPSLSAEVIIGSAVIHAAHTVLVFLVPKTFGVFNFLLHCLVISVPSIPQRTQFSLELSYY